MFSWNDYHRLLAARTREVPRYKWLTVNRPWVRDDLERFQRGKYNGLDLSQQRSLDFPTADLGKVEALQVMSSPKLRDQSSIEALETLRDLVVLAPKGARRRIDFAALLKLERVVIDERPGMGSLAGHRTLRQLELFNMFEGVPESLRSPAPQLSTLTVAGGRRSRPHVDLSVLEHHKSLARLAISNCRVSNVDWLASIPGLVDLQFRNVETEGRSLDLSCLGALATLRSVTIRGSKVSEGSLKFLTEQSHMNVLVD